MLIFDEDYDSVLGTQSENPFIRSARDDKRATTQHLAQLTIALLMITTHVRDPA